VRLYRNLARPVVVPAPAVTAALQAAE
jgi:hypothetical protein